MKHNKQQTKIEEIDRVARKYKEQADLDFLRKNSVHIENYFDTYHVFPLIQGYWEIQNILVSNWNSNIFSNDKFLVQSLAYFGYIKTIRIMLPHAVELGHQLGKRSLLPNEIADINAINQFLERINLKSLDELQNAKGNLEQYIASITAKSEDIFKANYVLTELHWIKRYNRLFNPKDPIVSFDTVKYDNSAILNSPLFHQVITALENIPDRKFLSVNNLRDAMALCMFYEKVKQFQVDGKALPLFYVSRTVINILPEEISKLFTVEVHKKSINVLKDSEFFIIDAMFNEKTIAESVGMFTNAKNLKELFYFYSDGQRFLANELDELYDSWKQFRLNDFFEKIVADGHASKGMLKTNIRDLLYYVDKNQEDIQPLLEKGRQKLINSFKQKTSDFSFLESIWKTVASFDEVYKNRVNKENLNFINNDPDIFRDEGITRFSPPTGNVEAEIKLFWNHFLEAFQKKSKNEIQALKVRLTRLIYESLCNKAAPDCDKITIAICILWVFGQQNFIIELLENRKIDYGKHFHIGLILLASMIKCNKISPRNQRKMGDIISQIESRADYDVHYQSWIGMGFIKFNIWRLLARRSDIPSSYSGYIHDAIELSLKAFKRLEKIKEKDERKVAYRNVKYLYSLNNFIYYTLEGNFQNVYTHEFHENYIEKLEEGQNSSYWQAIFDDTLALYYLKKARKTLSQANRVTFIKNAENFIDHAIKTSILHDDRFNTRRTQITMFKDEYKINF